VVGTEDTIGAVLHVIERGPLDPLALIRMIKQTLCKSRCCACRPEAADLLPQDSVRVRGEVADWRSAKELFPVGPSMSKSPSLLLWRSGNDNTFVFPLPEWATSFWNAEDTCVSVSRRLSRILPGGHAD
jgi:hypothetical protein